MATKKTTKIKLPYGKAAKLSMLKKLFIREKGNPKKRLEALRDKTGCGMSTLWRYYTAGKWMEDVEKYGAAIERQRDVEEAAAEISNVDKDLEKLTTSSFSELTSDIKGMASLMIRTTKSITGVAALLVTHYAGRIEELLRDVQYDPERLTTVNLMRMEMYEKKMAKYHGMIGEYIKPTAVQGYLNTINFRDNANMLPEDAELGVLTPTDMIKHLANVGFNSVIGSMDATVEMYRQAEMDGVRLPEINGMKVKDASNNMNVDAEDVEFMELPPLPEKARTAPKKKMKINLQGI